MQRQDTIRYALVFVALMAPACSSDAVNSPTSGAITQWVVNAVTIPTTGVAADQIAYDLDGDGTGDDQLGQVFAALQAAGGSAFGFQAVMNAAIADGSIVQLISVQSDDDALASDAAAAAEWYTGQPTAGFTTGAHTIDQGVTAGSFVGGLASSSYSSRNPVTTKSPVAVTVRLKLFGAAPAIELHLNGAHVQWHFSGTTGIASGELHGSLSEDDVNNVLIPEFAVAINTQIQSDTAATTSHDLLSLFDIGGCAGAVADDGNINLCEFASNPLIETLFRPDLHVYSATGAYQPAATGTANAVSVAFGFTAVRTTF